MANGIKTNFVLFFGLGYSLGMSNRLHPCQKCGACCASFRVSFYWLGAEPEVENSVPLKLIEDLTPSLRCMKGTDKKHNPKCNALTGKIGEFVNCSIYLNRPTPCRSFKASYEHGLKEPRCDEAREKHGLKPLTKDDHKGLVDTKPLIPKNH
jgi:uncharacterized protein